MDVINAGQLGRTDEGREVIVPLVWDEDGKAAEVARGVLVSVDQWVGRTAIVVANGSARQEIELSPDMQVRLP